MTLVITPAAALDAVGFSVSSPDTALAEDLENVSLVVTAHRDEVTDPQELMSAARSDYARFVGLLYERGFFGPVVSIRVDGAEAAEVSPLNVPARIRRIDIRIEPGAVYRFGAVSIDPIAPGTELPERFVSGEVARTQVIAQTGRQAIASWRDAGHAKAEVTGQRIVADHSRRVVSADLDVDEGPRVTFGDLIVTGNEEVRTERILAIAGLPTGEVFSPEAIDDTTANLRRTGAFSSIVVTEGDVGPDDVMDIEMAISEGLPRTFGFGAEFSNQDGVELTGFWTHRNFAGGAERLELDLRIEGIGAQNRDVGVAFSTRYTRPAVPRPDTDAFYVGDLALLEERDYSGQALTLAFGYQRRFSDQLTGEIGAGINLARINDAFGESEYALAILPTRLTYDGRNDILDATSGFFLDGQLLPFFAISGTDDGVRFFSDGRVYQALDADDRNVLAGRLQFGTVAGPDLRDTPNYFLFYSGGGGTVRGHEYQALGVDLPGGNRTGGRSFVGFSGEIRSRISENIQLVGFYDWGYIGPESIPDGSGQSHAGAGAGVRYITPIGPLRVDVGTPISGPDSGASLLLYIGIGQAF